LRASDARGSEGTHEKYFLAREGKLKRNGFQGG